MSRKETSAVNLEIIDVISSCLHVNKLIGKGIYI